MNIALDIIVVAIVLIVMCCGARKGFAHAIVEFAGYAALLTFSLLISTGLSNITYRTLVEPRVCSTIESTIDEAGGENLSAAVDKIYDNLPSLVTNLSENQGITRESINEQLSTKMQSGASVAAQTVSNMLVKPIVTSIFTVVFLILVVIIGGFVIKWLAKIADKVFSVSFVGGINRFLGGLLGAVEGLIFAAIFVWVVSMIALMMSDGLFGITADVIDSTHLFKIIKDLNPLA